MSATLVFAGTVGGGGGGGEELCIPSLSRRAQVTDSP